MDWRFHKGGGCGRKKKEEKKLEPRPKDFLVFSFEFFDPILSQVFLQDSVQKCGLQRATSHLESYEICSLRRSLHARLKQSKGAGSRTTKGEHALNSIVVVGPAAILFTKQSRRHCILDSCSCNLDLCFIVIIMLMFFYLCYNICRLYNLCLITLLCDVYCSILFVFTSN
jgi:hypothetical protein